jgi:hypothetical protein
MNQISERNVLSANLRVITRYPKGMMSSSTHTGILKKGICIPDSKSTSRKFNDA